MKEELISIIIPVYQVKEYLPMCMDSIFAQTYSNWELILVDDGSKDGSAEVCDHYVKLDPRVNVIHQVNQGVSAARNAGIERAKGEYIAFLDADDYITRDYLEVLYRDIVENDADMACCNFYKVDCNTNEAETVNGISSPKLITDCEQLYRDIIEKKGFYWANVWGKLCKASLVQKCRFRPLQFGEDNVFVFDMFAYSPAVYLNPYHGYYYVRRATSATMSVDSMSVKQRKDLVEVECYRWKNLPQIDQSIKDAFLRQYALRIHNYAYASALSEESHEETLSGHVKNVIAERKKYGKKVRYSLMLYALSPKLHRTVVRALHSNNMKTGRI